ncbi:MAG TPA: response regulator transcription factor [Acidimicrobiia bacterium]|jgi:DNA-binding NarL/FixJ family response regulator|nr:response regulator transcription factor [Acidimicrobiia bacterium]
MSTVLIVDDAELFRAALASAVKEAGFEVVATAADAMSAIRLAKEHQPDLVLLDVLMPGMSGLEVVSSIMNEAPKTAVVLLTSSESSEDLLAAVKAGARGYLTKDTPLERLVAALREVESGGAATSPAMEAKLFEIVGRLLRTRDVAASRRPALTGREIEILREVADGHTSRQISDKLYISENTVKNHIRNVLDKTGLGSRHDAVLYAIREGIIDP